MSTPWSELGDTFLSEGEWAIGQGPDAPDRLLLREIIRALEPSSLIDVGCGPGLELDSLVGSGVISGVDYLGLDLTPELVESCRDRYPGVAFEAADVQEELPRRADVVWCRHVLEHVEDGEAGLRNVAAAASGVALVSWFIRPTWSPYEVGSGVSDGFLHQTYSARRMIEVARDGHRDVYRLDFDHHLTRASVWIIGTNAPAERAAVIAGQFAKTDEFLDALISVPPDPREAELREALRTIEETAEHARRLTE